MSSQSSNSAPQANTSASHILQPELGVAAMPAALLAQSVDQLAQAHGLTPDARHQLHLHAVQTNPSVAGLWLYALSLSHLGLFQQLSQQIDVVNQRLDDMGNLIRHEWQLTHSQQEAIKHMQKIFITQSKTSYRDLGSRTKAYLAAYPTQFSLPMYLTDNAVATKVNRMVDSDAHQVRGSYRKLIFAAAVGPRPLDAVIRRIAPLYTTEFGEGPIPNYYKAHIAQLRQIAFEIIKVATIPPPGAPRPRNDYGFWTAVETKFTQLIATHGADYDNGPGWRTWESEIIAFDESRYNDVTQHFSPAVVEHFAPKVYARMLAAGTA